MVYMWGYKHYIQYFFLLFVSGNLLVPNDNYCKFEDWIIPIFDEMLKEQNTQVS